MMAGMEFSPSDRRTLSRGVLAISMIVAIGKGVPALERLQESRVATAHETLRELATLRAASKGSEAIRDSLRARQHRLGDLENGLLHAPTPQRAAAQIATLLAAYATVSGARVSATVLRPDTGFVKGIARVTVRLSIATDVQGLAALMKRIEDDDRMLAVRELTVSGNDPGGSETRAEILSADMLIEALALRSPAAVKALGTRR
jgi:hypothetical protein